MPLNREQAQCLPVACLIEHNYDYISYYKKMKRMNETLAFSHKQAPFFTTYGIGDIQHEAKLLWFRASI